MKVDVHIKVGKKESKVVKKDFGEYEVWVKARPIKSAANKELIKVLAKYFNVKPYCLRITKGLTSPIKTLELGK